jgi:hypothetical protein
MAGIENIKNPTAQTPEKIKRFVRKSAHDSYERAQTQLYLNYFAGNIAVMGIVNQERRDQESRKRAVKAACEAVRTRRVFHRTELLGIYPLVFQPQEEERTTQLTRMVRTEIAGTFEGKIVSSKRSIGVEPSSTELNNYRGLVEVAKGLINVAYELGDDRYKLSAHNIGFIAVTSPIVAHSFITYPSNASPDITEETIAVLDEVNDNYPYNNTWSQFRPQFEGISANDPMIRRVEQGLSGSRPQSLSDSAIQRVLKTLQRIRS